MYTTEKLAVYKILFNQMQSYVATDIAEAIITKYIGQDFCTRISEITLKGTDGEDVDLTEVQVLLDDYVDEVGMATKLDSYINTETIEEIVARKVTEGLTWSLTFLEKSIGLLSSGKLICLGARPSTGKTTFLATEVVNFLPQIQPDKNIYWFNNEEEDGSVKKRILQCGINWLNSEIDDDPVGAVLAFEKKYGDFSRIKVVNAVSFNQRMVEDMCKHGNVGVIIIDQLRKVRGHEKRTSSEVERLELTYQWARELAKKYAPVITVHQLKGEAEGVAYPTMSMLYGSTTAIQGEVDSLIMLGRNHSDANPNMRYISIVKSKEASGPKVDPSLSEGKDTLELIPHLGKFEELLP
jgi:replicative DNA helicase